MSEEEKNEEVKNKLSKLIIGKNDTASSEIKGYRFTYHAPTALEQLAIQVEANNLRIGATNADLDLKIYTTIIATFNVLCDEIAKVEDKEGRNLNPIEIQMLKDEKGNAIRKIKFWEFVQNIKNPTLYTTLLLPLYDDYIKFQNELAIKYDDLKN